MKKLNEVSRPINIMLVEDNPGDVILTKKAFQKGKLANELTIAPDGEIALKILNKEGEYADCETPDIIFLDLNLPVIDGIEVLKIIKETDALKRIPVVVLTSSDADKDIVSTYDLHASGYIVKPLSLDKFINIVETIESFWFSINVYPG